MHCYLLGGWFADWSQVLVLAKFVVSASHELQCRQSQFHGVHRAAFTHNYSYN